jgi:hypothetical protein
MKGNRFRNNGLKITEKITEYDSCDSAEPSTAWRLREFVLRTECFFPFNYAYRLIYRISIVIFLTAYRLNREVEAVYLRRGLNLEDWVPGSSDIDYYIVIKKTDKKTVDAIMSLYCMLKKIFPFIGELQISTMGELYNYIKYGDARAYEALHSWKVLFGKKLPGIKFHKDKLKLHADLINEALNSYQMLNEMCFSPANEKCNDLKIYKAVTDIIRYTRHAGQQSSGIPESRMQALEHFKSGSIPDAYTGILERIKRFRKNSWMSSEKDRISLLYYAVNYLDTQCGLLNKMLTQKTEDTVGSALAEKLFPADEKDCADASGWEALAGKILGASGDTVKSLLMNSPGLFYVFLDGIPDAAGILDLVGKVKKIRKESLAGHTKIILVTDNIFSSMINTLHLENPFNYYVYRTCGGNSSAGCRDQKIFTARFENKYVLLPAGKYRSRLLRECVTLISIFYRTKFSGNPRGFSKDILEYFLPRILGLKCAIEKNSVAIPFSAENSIRLFKMEFSEYARDKRLLAAEKLMLEDNLTDCDKTAVSGLIDETYCFLSEIISRLNGDIGRMDKKNALSS